MKYAVILLATLLFRVGTEPVSNYIIIPKDFAYSMALKQIGNQAFPPPTFFIGNGDTFYVCDPNMADLFYTDFKPLYDSGLVNPAQIIQLSLSSFPTPDTL